MREAKERARSAGEPARLRIAQREAAAASAIEVGRRAVVKSEAEVNGLRRTLAEEWRAEYLRERVRVSHNISASRYDSDGTGSFCVTITNSGNLVVVRPRLTIRFRGRSLEEMGLQDASRPWAPITRLANFGELMTPSVSYRNRFDERVDGLRPNAIWGSTSPGSTFERSCIFLSGPAARAGDVGRIFEQAGGYSAAAADWSVTLVADLAHADSLREVRSDSYDGRRAWEHVPAAAVDLFADRLSAVRPAPTAPPTLPPNEAPPSAAALVVPSPTASVATGLPPPATPQIRVLSGVEVQRRLRDLGYYRGLLDGQVGPGTRASIRVFERSRGLPETGEVAGPTEEALLSLP